MPQAQFHMELLDALRTMQVLYCTPLALLVASKLHCIGLYLDQQRAFVG